MIFSADSRGICHYPICSGIPILSAYATPISLTSVGLSICTRYPCSERPTRPSVVREWDSVAEICTEATALPPLLSNSGNLFCGMMSHVYVLSEMLLVRFKESADWISPPARIMVFPVSWCFNIATCSVRCLHRT